MRINIRKFADNGFEVTNDDTGDILIYPRSSYTGLLDVFKEIMVNDGMPARDADIMADEFAGKYTNKIIWNLMEI